MMIESEIKILKLNGEKMSTYGFKNIIRKKMEEVGMIVSPIDNTKIDYELKDFFMNEIKKLEEKIKETLPEEVNKLRNRIKELEGLNEHIRNIYKRDLKKELKMEGVK